MQALLEARAGLEATRSDGSTALITAAYMGHTEVVQALLSAGASLDPRDADGTALRREARAYAHGLVHRLRPGRGDAQPGGLPLQREGHGAAARGRERAERAGLVRSIICRPSKGKAGLRDEE